MGPEKKKVKTLLRRLLALLINASLALVPWEAGENLAAYTIDAGAEEKREKGYEGKSADHAKFLHLSQTLITGFSHCSA